MRLALVQCALFGMVALPWAFTPARRVVGATFCQGRKLLMGSPYVLPHDGSEDARLDAQHALMQMVLGALHLAPLSVPQTILDIGCGTGIWCREMAALYPSATIVGLDYDISALTHHSKPRNVFWREADALQLLPIASNTVDFVHQRFAATWIPFGRWPDVLSELVRVTRPGGYVELVEGSMPASQDKAYTALGKTFEMLLRQRGMKADIGVGLAKLLEMAGLEEVQERRFTTGETPEQQALLLETTRQGFKALVPLLSKQLAPADYAAYLANLAAVLETTPEVRRQDVVVWGRKPR